MDFNRVSSSFFCSRQKKSSWSRCIRMMWSVPMFLFFGVVALGAWGFCHPPPKKKTNHFSTPAPDIDMLWENFRYYWLLWFFFLVWFFRHNSLHSLEEKSHKRMPLRLCENVTKHWLHYATIKRRSVWVKNRFKNFQILNRLRCFTIH